MPVVKLGLAYPIAGDSHGAMINRTAVKKKGAGGGGGGGGGKYYSTFLVRLVSYPDPHRSCGWITSPSLLA